MGCLFCFVFTENCLQMNNFVGGITGPPLPFAANNNLPNSVTTSYVTRHKKFFLKKWYLMIFLIFFFTYKYKIFQKFQSKNVKIFYSNSEFRWIIFFCFLYHTLLHILEKKWKKSSTFFKKFYPTMCLTNCFFSKQDIHQLRFWNNSARTRANILKSPSRKFDFEKEPTDIFQNVLYPPHGGRLYLHSAHNVAKKLQ